MNVKCHWPSCEVIQQSRMLTANKHIWGACTNVRSGDVKVCWKALKIRPIRIHFLFLSLHDKENTQGIPL